MTPCERQEKKQPGAQDRGNQCGGRGSSPARAFPMSIFCWIVPSSSSTVPSSPVRRVNVFISMSTYIGAEYLQRVSEKCVSRRAGRSGALRSARGGRGRGLGILPHRRREQGEERRRGAKRKAGHGRREEGAREISEASLLREEGHRLAVRLSAHGFGEVNLPKGNPVDLLLLLLRGEARKVLLVRLDLQSGRLICNRGRAASAHEPSNLPKRQGRGEKREETRLRFPARSSG